MKSVIDEILKEHIFSKHDNKLFQMCQKIAEVKIGMELGEEGGGGTRHVRNLPVN